MTWDRKITHKACIASQNFTFLAARRVREYPSRARVNLATVPSGRLFRFPLRPDRRQFWRQTNGRPAAAPSGSVSQRPARRPARSGPAAPDARDHVQVVSVFNPPPFPLPAAYRLAAASPPARRRPVGAAGAGAAGRDGGGGGGRREGCVGSSDAGRF